MPPQRELIDRVRALCAADDRLDAALTYGSIPQGRGDEHSDVEFWLFFAPTAWPEVDPVAWCAEVAPVRHIVVNEFGTHVVFFGGLLRGEFHFALSTDIPSVGTWPARGATVEAMLLLDRSGRLRPVLESVPVLPVVDAGVERICGRFANWLLLAHHVEARGEELRAFDALGHVARHLLWMARLAEGRTEDWLTPSRAAEAALSPERLAAIRAVAAAPTAREGIVAAWRAGREWWTGLAGEVPGRLFGELDGVLGEGRSLGATRHPPPAPARPTLGVPRSPHPANPRPESREPRTETPTPPPLSPIPSICLAVEAIPRPTG